MGLKFCPESDAMAIQQSAPCVVKNAGQFDRLWHSKFTAPYRVINLSGSGLKLTHYCDVCVCFLVPSVDREVLIRDRQAISARGRSLVKVRISRVSLFLLECSVGYQFISACHGSEC